MQLRHLRRVDPAQYFWKDVAHRGEAAYHPALVALVERESTLVTAEVGQEIIEGLRGIGFTNEYPGRNVHVPVELVP